MSLSNRNHNFIQECVDQSANVLALRNQLEDIVARWNLHSISSDLIDEDIQATASFSHLSKGDITSCIAAFQAVLTALGSNTSGQAINLIKMKP